MTYRRILLFVQKKQQKRIIDYIEAPEKVLFIYIVDRHNRKKSWRKNRIKFTERLNLKSTFYVCFEAPRFCVCVLQFFFVLPHCSVRNSSHGIRVDNKLNETIAVMWDLWACKRSFFLLSSLHTTDDASHPCGIHTPFRWGYV